MECRRRRRWRTVKSDDVRLKKAARAPFDSLDPESINRRPRQGKKRIEGT